MSRCNGCSHDEKKKKYRSRLLTLWRQPDEFGNVWDTDYLLGAKPLEGQGEPLSYKGQPIQFLAGYLKLAHSYDEDCNKPANDNRCYR